jgi:hypothetical protein
MSTKQTLVPCKFSLLLRKKYVATRMRGESLRAGPGSPDGPAWRRDDGEAGVRLREP